MKNLGHTGCHYFCRMSFYREFSKAITTSAAKKASQVPWYLKESEAGYIGRLYCNVLYPLYHKYIRVPKERWFYNACMNELRDAGLMFDDKLNPHDPIIGRALEIMPHEFHVHRMRRLLRASDLVTKKQYLPMSERNYDPFLPYMAPYIEEAKYIIQEEQELLNFQPQDRKVYTAGVSGFGESTPGSTLLSL